MHTQSLLDPFFQECKKQLSFLEKNEKFTSISGLTQYHKGRVIIIPYYTQDHAQYPFYALSRYESNTSAIEISYGDYDLSLHCHIIYKQTYRFELSTLLQAINAPQKQNCLFDHLTKEKTIHDAISTIKKYLKTHIKSLRDFDEHQINHALDIQSLQLHDKIKKRHEDQLTATCTKAKIAFDKKDYKKVIMILRPIKDHLNPEYYRLLTLSIYGLQED